MPYNFDQIPNRRAKNVVNKWTFFPKDTLPMWIADMDFSAPPLIQKALHNLVEHGYLGYQLPPHALFEIVVARMEKLYDWKITPEMIVPIPGVNSGYNVAARAFCTSRKGYMIQTPVYNEFLETQQKTGAPQVTAPMEKKITGNRIRYEVDYDAFARGAQKVNLFLLSKPHNPVGKIFSRTELKRMAKLCIQNDVLIVSDEIHSELLLAGNTFQPLASLGREIANRTITLISASKAFNVPGLFCAFAIIPNEKVRKDYQEMVFKMGYTLTSPGMLAARVAYAGQCDAWLKALRQYLTDNRDFLVDYVTKYIPKMRLTVPSATYLAWLDCTDLKLKPSPYEFFLKEAKVALSDGSKFGEAGRQFVRLNFGTARRVLKQGLEQMRSAIDHAV